MVDVWSSCHVCQARWAKHSTWREDGRLYLCCSCWVTQGHQPFEWHLGCSEPHAQPRERAS
jgi:hypothetical protein